MASGTTWVHFGRILESSAAPCSIWVGDKHLGYFWHIYGWVLSKKSGNLVKPVEVPGFSTWEMNLVRFLNIVLEG